MSLASRIVQILNAGIIKFLNIVTLSHPDYPYHDYHSVADGSEPETYVVGKNNMEANGDHHKLFVSKSTLFYSDVACTIRLNHRGNVTTPIIAGIPITFQSNIHTVHVLTIGTDGTLYMWFEGVLPQEARRPE